MFSVSVRRVDVQVHLVRRDGLSRRVEPNEPRDQASQWLTVKDRVSVCKRGAGQCSGGRIFELRISSRVHGIIVARMMSMSGCHEGDQWCQGVLEVFEGPRKHGVRRHALNNRRAH